jgi:hypothetical protein
VDEADLKATNLGDEHVLSRREVTNAVDTPFHVRVEDSPRVSAVVAVIERAQHPNHEISDPLEIAAFRFADDDVVLDQSCGQGAPPVVCYGFTT